MVNSSIIREFLRARFNVNDSCGICAYLTSSSRNILIDEFKLNSHLFDKNVLSPSALLFLEGEIVDFNKKYIFGISSQATLARIKLIDIILSKYGNI